MKIRTLKLRDEAYGDQWYTQIEDHWEYDQFLADPRWRAGWISMDSVLYNSADDRVYLGITSFDADIFRAYDRRTGQFLDLGYKRIAHPQDAKFHRSLVRRQADGCLYGAITLLHDVDRYWDAPGGAIVKYDPATGSLEKLGIPVSHAYIQSICLSQRQDALFGQTFTPERLFRFDLTTREACDLGPISSGMAMAQGENVELDDAGCVWCGWHVTRAWQGSSGVDSHRLCKYDPATDHIHYLDGGLPRPDGAYGYVKVEGLFNLGRGCLYASGGNGSIYRVDTDTGQGTYLGTPIPDRPSRLTTLRLAGDGMAYGVTGRAGRCELIRFDPRTEKYELIGPVVEGETALWQAHDVTVTPEGVLYVGENDNPYRSSYLWEITL